MYIGPEAFEAQTDREAAKHLFRQMVQRIEVETHSYCNRRCDYCPNAVGDRLGENRRMADDLWCLLLDNLREIAYRGNFIFTSYNEPLADRLILQRIREARAHLPHARLMIYSNGDYVDRAYLDELAAAGLNYLHVSIHTRPGGKYGDVPALNHIAKLAKRTGGSVRYQTLRPNEYIIAAIPHKALEIEVRAINYTRHGTDRGGLVGDIATPAARTLPCFFPFAHFHMGYEGTVVPCCHIRSDAEQHKPYRYGNLRDFGSIYQIFAGEAAAAWRRHLISFEPKRPPCNTCSVAFLSQDPKVLDQVRHAWETHVQGKA